MNRPLVEAARKYVGVKFRHQGRGAKLDCVGLVVRASHDVGMDVKDYFAYDADPDGKELIARLSAVADPVRTPELGDIAVFWYKTRNYPQHIGIVSEVGLIHTWASAGEVTEHVMDDFWKVRLMGYWRLR